MESPSYSPTEVFRILTEPAFTAEKRALACENVYDALEHILQHQCSTEFLEGFFQQLCQLRRNRVYYLLQEKGAPPKCVLSSIIVEAMLRLITFDLACSVGEKWADLVRVTDRIARQEQRSIESARANGIETDVTVIRPHLYRMASYHNWNSGDEKAFDDVGALGCASLICFPYTKPEDDDWFINGRPSFTALRICERWSTINAAAAMLRNELEKNEDSGIAPFVEEHVPLVIKWTRRWKGDLADPHRDLLGERLLRALPDENACTPLDEATPNYWDSEEKEGTQAKTQPYAFRLNNSRPDRVNDIIKNSRESIKTVWDEPDDSTLLEAAAVATLHHSIQQLCDVKIIDRFIFDDCTPIETLAHLKNLNNEKNSIRYVPRLIRSRGTWFVVLPSPDISPNFKCARTNNWADAIARWCVLLKDGNAKGMIARGMSAENTVLSILGQNVQSKFKDPIRAALAGNI